MHGLQTIKKVNNDAATAYCANNGQPHLLNAPTASNFDYNIPWEYDPVSSVLAVHIHRDTKVHDLMKLKQMIAGKYGPQFQVKERLYE